MMKVLIIRNIMVTVQKIRIYRYFFNKILRLGLNNYLINNQKPYYEKKLSIISNVLDVGGSF